VAGATLGVWTFGRSVNYDASFGLTFVGSLLGGGLGAVVAIPLVPRHLAFAGLITAGSTVLGASTMYELTGNRRAHRAQRAQRLLKQIDLAVAAELTSERAKPRAIRQLAIVAEAERRGRADTSRARMLPAS
jgi:hypothetical protein